MRRELVWGLIAFSSVAASASQGQVLRSANTHAMEPPATRQVIPSGNVGQPGELVQAPITSRESLDLRSADIYAADHPTVRAVAYLGVLIQSRTMGRYRISTLGESSANSESFTIASVRNGTLDMARVNFAALSGSVPEAIVPALPGLFRSTQHQRHVLDGQIGRDLLAALDRQNLVGLCFYDTGPRSYYGSKPIRKASDLSGLRVAIPQFGPWASVLRVPGETMLPMPYTQVGAALKNGAIDLAEESWPTFVSSGHYKVARYFNETEHSATPSVLIFSKRRWLELSQTDREQIQTAARDSVREFRAFRDESEALARRTAREAGVEVISDVDRSSFTDAAAALYPTLSPELQDLVRRIKDTR
ncbi:TRAP-type C4-dicarboxylate transport system, substrate-binding protein [Enhydrobacter aerosaccus]|uniref:TRAP-type C4-dicarboxylate transport system, substrate-binding protein n=1 Tax=Enhydrobacter aerosaccus TaxID=225324 RepID=A0A1T4NSE3_9HYPH|nr:TRAP transporter substrate-binding protein DctP [Enhydrobacter aerosaccus]SJZ82173.1 TRAP-type C4-dicarboxylate transport system, substrate-binding protein [Enhydrobacter aerosaccus]